MRLARTVPAAWAVWLAATAALAQPAGGDDERDTAAARALFREARRLTEAEQYSEAADRLQRALALRESAALHHNLGVVLERLGRLVEATEHLHAAQRLAQRGDPALDASQRALREIEPRVARLTVAASGAAEGCTIRVGDHDLRAELLGVPVPADPGTAVVSAVCGGTERARTEVVLPEGGEGTARLVVPPWQAEAPRGTDVAPRTDVPRPSDGTASGPVDAPPDPAPGGPAADRRRNIAWLLVAAGALAAGVLLDQVPSSSRNDTLEALDFVPAGLYAAGGVSAVLWVAKF